MSIPLVYSFGGGRADGGKEDKRLLGGKGANLAEMTRLGVPVPPGFTLTTEVCRYFLREHGYPEGLREAVAEGVARLERETGKRFGGGEQPLLVSVRSGAAVSMPGMMDTILNLGLNDATAAALASAAGDERFAYDSYRRFVQMYGGVVLGVAARRFEERIEACKAARGVEQDTELDAAALRGLVAEFKALIEAEAGAAFPESPEAQLWGAIEAVFRSWNSDRAIAYRRVHEIPDDLGTAVNVVAMVYGNMGEDSGTGVAFTRDPATGERRFFGEFLMNAQGEDVVAGIRDPLAIEEMARRLPGAYQELVRVQETLERHYRDVQDIEFTVERGRLYLLQTRSAKRTVAAAVRIAVEMVDEGLIDPAEAVRRVEPGRLNHLLHRQVDPDVDAPVLAVGLPASPGAAAGQAVFDPDTAAARAAGGDAVVLVRNETSPDDFHGMVAACAIVTARGGMTSHAAVVARGMGKCCVVGARDLRIEPERRVLTAGEHTVAEGDWITVDGSTGRVLVGRVPTVEPELSSHYQRLMAWADGFRMLRVRTNADTPADARRAREFGAEGIGLCRTEHMFFDGERLQAFREMILAPAEEARRRALERLLPMQRSDFEGIFRAMDGLPVTIRLLDPPLHEFLPRGEEEVRRVAETLGIDVAELARRVERHREANPMLGHRGVRLGISHPEITEMQVRAIFEAAVAVARDGVRVQPEVMVPLVGDVAELRDQAALVRRVADEVLAAADVAVPYLVGTMIELPRAALTAGAIAAEADFFSFGTNDLTQTTYGISRDDAGTFLPYYLEHGIFPADPFQVLDQEGVGQLVERATRDGRTVKPALKVGVCGEHGGEPSSVDFFHRTGLDYVSCSPFRVPVARLAAAHAALRESAETDAGAAGTATSPPGTAAAPGANRPAGPRTGRPAAAAAIRATRSRPTAPAGSSRGAGPQ
ncbi:MAG TPA: pyruvate, phosphate dikinase [Longimicrobiales bacterium]